MLDIYLSLSLIWRYSWCLVSQRTTSHRMEQKPIGIGYYFFGALSIQNDVDVKYIVTKVVRRI